MAFVDDDEWNAYVCEQFQFNPASSVLIGVYLKNKILGKFDFGSARPIVEVNMYGKEEENNPWKLFGDDFPWQRGDMYGKKLFVFTVLSNVGKTQKSSNKQKSRIAGDGSWRVNGKERPEVDEAGKTIGYKRALTFKSKKQTVGHWNMDEFSIDPAAFPQELRGHELECQNLVLCRISSKNETEDVASTSKKRKSAVIDDDDHSCIIDDEQPSDLMDEASSSKRPKVAVPQEEAAYAPEYFNPMFVSEFFPDYFKPMSDAEFVDTCINFDDLL